MNEWTVLLLRLFKTPKEKQDLCFANNDIHNWKVLVLSCQLHLKAFETKSEYILVM
jgi:hypothetical protein